MIIVIIFFLGLFVIFWVWLSVVRWTMKNGISPMPTSVKVKNKVLALIPLSTQGTVVDLGSGWGHMARKMAKLLPHCQVIGYETSPIPYLVSKFWSWWNKDFNLRFYRKDFFHVPLNNVSLIYCYLYPGAMDRLRKKFDDELTPGTIVITNTFAVHEWEPIQVLQVEDMYRTRVYVYVKSNSNVDALHARPMEEETESVGVDVT